MVRHVICSDSQLKALIEICINRLVYNNDDEEGASLAFSVVRLSGGPSPSHEPSNWAGMKWGATALKFIERFKAEPEISMMRYPRTLLVLYRVLAESWLVVPDDQLAERCAKELLEAEFFDWLAVGAKDFIHMIREVLEKKQHSHQFAARLKLLLSIKCECPIPLAVPVVGHAYVKTVPTDFHQLFASA